MMKYITVLLILLASDFTSAECQIADTVKYTSLGPYDFHIQYLTTDSSVLIDVREPFEFRGKHIKNAINIPSSGNIERVADTLNKSCSLFLYCTSGYRSSRAAEKLHLYGFRNIYNLEGGINAWKKLRLPVTKGKKKKGT